MMPISQRNSGTAYKQTPRSPTAVHVQCDKTSHTFHHLAHTSPTRSTSHDGSPHHRSFENSQPKFRAGQQVKVKYNPAYNQWFPATVLSVASFGASHKYTVLFTNGERQDSISENLICSNEPTSNAEDVEDPTTVPVPVGAATSVTAIEGIAATWLGGYLWKIPFKRQRKSVPRQRWFHIMLPSAGAAPLLMWYDLRIGQKTPAFEHMHTRRGGDLLPPTHLCFSLISEDRTVDLAALDSHSVALWLRGLQLLIPPYRGMQHLQLVQQHRGLPPSMTQDPRSVRVVTHDSHQQINKDTVPSPVRGNIKYQSNIPTTPSSRATNMEFWTNSLFNHVKYNRYEDVSRLFLEDGCPVDIIDRNSGDTALLLACRCGWVQIATLCLRCGAKFDPHPDYGQTALQAAVSNGHKSCTRLLLETAALSGASKHVVNLEDSSPRKETVLHMAVRQNSDDGLVELLLRHGADISLVDALGRVPLHICSTAGQLKHVQTLLKVGAAEQMHIGDQLGNTALHYAAIGNYPNIVRKLLEHGASTRDINTAGQTAFQVALVEANVVGGVRSILQEFENYTASSPKRRSGTDYTYNRCLTPGEHSPKARFRQHSFSSAAHSTHTSPTRRQWADEGMDLTEQQYDQQWADDQYDWEYDQEYYDDPEYYDQDYDYNQEYNEQSYNEYSENITHVSKPPATPKTKNRWGAPLGETVAPYVGLSLPKSLFKSRAGSPSSADDTAQSPVPYPVQSESWNNKQYDVQGKEEQSWEAGYVTELDGLAEDYDDEYETSTTRGFGDQEYKTEDLETVVDGQGVSWQVNYDEDGNKYFCNNVTGVSQWEDPRPSVSDENQTPDDGQWQEYYADDGPSPTEGHQWQGYDNDDMAVTSFEDEWQQPGVNNARWGPPPVCVTNIIDGKENENDMLQGGDGEDCRDDISTDRNIDNEIDDDNSMLQGHCLEKPNQKSEEIETETVITKPEEKQGQVSNIQEEELLQGGSIIPPPPPRSDASKESKITSTGPTGVIKPMSIEEIQSLKRWNNMANMGVPLPALMIKMNAEGMSPHVIAHFQQQQLSAPNNRNENSNNNTKSVRKSLKLKLDTPPDDEKEIVIPSKPPTREEQTAMAKKEPKLMKFLRMSKMGVPINAVRQKMVMEGINCSLIDRFCGKVTKPSRKKVTDTKTSCSNQVSAGEIKMRKLHWNEISADKIKDSVFGGTNGNDGKVLADEEIAQLQKLFATSRGTPKHAKQKQGSSEDNKSSSSEVKKGKKTRTRLLEFKRANNVSIGLAQFKSLPGFRQKKFSAVSIALLHFFDKKSEVEEQKNNTKYGNLSEQKINTLQKILPSSKECSLVADYVRTECRKLQKKTQTSDKKETILERQQRQKQIRKSVIQQLGLAEQFFLEIGRVRRCNAKVRSINITLGYEAAIAKLNEQARILEVAAEQVTSSKRLKAVMDTVLAIGNIMNNNNATGFTLDSLLKLTHTKSADNKTNLLEYIATVLMKNAKKARKEAEQSKIPEAKSDVVMKSSKAIETTTPRSRNLEESDAIQHAVHFDEDLSAVPAARHSSPSDMLSLLRTLRIQLRDVEKEISACASDEKDAIAWQQENEMKRKALSESKSPNLRKKSKFKKPSIYNSQQNDWAAKLDVWLKEAKLNEKDLVNRVTRASEACCNAAAYFGEDRTPEAAKNTFIILDEFIKAFKASHERIIKHLRARRRAKKAELLKQQKATTRKNSKSKRTEKVTEVSQTKIVSNESKKNSK